MAPLHAALAGATGLIGGFCLAELLASKDIAHVTSLGRRPLERRDSKLDDRQTDFDRLQELKLKGPLDVAFCCLGTTIKTAGSQEAFRKVDFDFVLKFGDWSRSQGARHFSVVSAMGANPSSPVFYNRVKGEMEAAVARLGFQTVDIFRPSLLLGPRQEFRRAEKIGERMMKLVDPILAKFAPDYRPIEASEVARAMVRAALDPQTGIRVHLSDEIRRLAHRNREAISGR